MNTVLNLNVERWDMLTANHEPSELDFGNHDISSICDYISSPNVEDGMPWNYGFASTRAAGRNDS